MSNKLGIFASVFMLLGITVNAQTGLSHDEIYPIPAAYTAEQYAYQPLLQISSGCFPYTAVDSAGNWNNGLKDSGSASGSCSSDNFQQVYVRQKSINASTVAIMYAYYFPKDNGYIFASIGHRHDWEHVVVFVENYGQASEKLLGAAYSAHGGVSTSTSPNRSGKNIYIKYGYNGSVTHSFVEGSSGTRNKHVLIRYAALSAAAKSTLNTEDYGEAVVPMRNNNFNAKIDQAADALGL